MSYLSYKELNVKPETLIHSLTYHRNKLKIRVYNTNPPFASQPAILAIRLPTTQRLSNITPLRTDYIDGKVTTNNKVELLIDLAKELKEDAIAILDLSHQHGLIAKQAYDSLLEYITKVNNDNNTAK